MRRILLLAFAIVPTDLPIVGRLTVIIIIRLARTNKGSRGL
jgi:hypothetical protein